jgi:phage terminase small subunit
MPKLLSGVKKNREMLKNPPAPKTKEKVDVEYKTDKQELLIEQLIMNPNSNKISLAIKCGYASKSADKVVSRLMNDSKFLKRIEDRKIELQDRLCVSLDRVAEEYARIAFLNPSDYVKYNKDGDIVSKASDVVDLKPVITINKGKYGKGVDLTFYNKMDALKSLRDMFGYDKPTKHAHLLAGNGQGLTKEGLESSIIGLITGVAPNAAPKTLD